MGEPFGLERRLLAQTLFAVITRMVIKSMETSGMTAIVASLNLFLVSESTCSTSVGHE